MNIVTLGTGSAVPTLDRGLSATAVVRCGEVWLFDCGEATQIRYRQARLSWSGLRAVFISHLHGDHVTGLMGLLMSLEMSDRQRPLDIVGPPGTREYVMVSKRLVRTHFSFAARVREAGEGTVLAGDDWRVEAAWLVHGLPTLGFAFVESARPGRFHPHRATALGVPRGPLWRQLQQGEPAILADGRRIEPHQVTDPPRPGRKVAYVVDTVPCPGAVRLARDADLLICDGAFGAGLEEHADRHGHLTSRQAAQLAREAGARRLLLTHISARHSDPQEILAGARPLRPDAQVAEDLLSIDLGPP